MHQNSSKCFVHEIIKEVVFIVFITFKQDKIDKIHLPLCDGKSCSFKIVLKKLNSRNIGSRFFGKFFEFCIFNTSLMVYVYILKNCTFFYVCYILKCQTVFAKLFKNYLKTIMGIKDRIEQGLIENPALQGI